MGIELRFIENSFHAGYWGMCKQDGASSTAQFVLFVAKIEFETFKSGAACVKNVPPTFLLRVLT